LSTMTLILLYDAMQIGTIYKRGISGGQQRRVAVAVEIVYSPELLCLDEPTSGLDTTTAVHTIQFLRSQLAASNGRAGYLMTIHQPNDEMLSLFDDVILMVGGGCVYSGTVAGAAEHFDLLEDCTVGIPGIPVVETYLRLTDTTFAMGRRPQNYPELFSDSRAAKTLAGLIIPYAKTTIHVQEGRSLGDHISSFCTLFSRMGTVARRDLTLFYVQYILQGTDHIGALCLCCSCTEPCVHRTRC
jgi:energy-coupling factor transporter ATP-binding protein EcfA2